MTQQPAPAPPSGAVPQRLSDLLPLKAIRLGVHAVDWRAAVTACGEALVAGGITTPAYTGEMIATVEQLGPYIVIAPGVALAHARPSPAVLRTGLSWVTLAQPVPFGHKENDPVRLVVGLAAPDNRSHVQGLATLAGLLEDADRRAALMGAQRPDEVLAMIVSYENSAVPPHPHPLPPRGERG